MPRRYVRRRPVPPEPELIPETEAATEAASFVSDAPSCAMTEKKWRGYPVWQCPKCRVDTLDPRLADAARRACRK